MAKADPFALYAQAPPETASARWTLDDELYTTHRCPCCGGRMIIIETFERGTTPRTRPATLALAIGFDSS